MIATSTIIYLIVMVGSIIISSEIKNFIDLPSIILFFVPLVAILTSKYQPHEIRAHLVNAVNNKPKSGIKTADTIKFFSFISKISLLLGLQISFTYSISAISKLENLSAIQGAITICVLPLFYAFSINGIIYVLTIKIK
ncbi:hypothetical protein ACBZ91_13340 [Vibrio natriegens]|uniref:hypothetical protein n=1 Tax=Vibrio natriegens TaxID=691 RepID=UPI0035575CA1